MNKTYFKKWVFPVLFGLMVYLTIRLVQDSQSGMRFWKRAWTINVLEVTISILFSYLLLWLYRRLFIYFTNKFKDRLTSRRIVEELAAFLLLNFVMVNAILTPFTAVTDDGLTWNDLVNLNTIPALYTIIYYSISQMNTYFTAYVDHKLRLEKLSVDHLQTELKFLKAQYHPHFLFNALNTIYFQMDENVAGAKKSVEKLSELLRYQLYDQQKMVTVGQELQYLDNFIALQKVRSSDRLKVHVEIAEGLGQQLIYPLLLLPLVENAFKYVGGDYCIYIKAFLKTNHFVVVVKNSLQLPEVTSVKPGGIGLDNLRRRLNLLYPGAHSFVVTQDPGTFTAQISLALTTI